MELILSLLLRISGAALIVDEKLYAWITMRAVRLIIKHGDVDFHVVVVTGVYVLQFFVFQPDCLFVVFHVLSSSSIELITSTDCLCYYIIRIIDPEWLM